MISQYLAFGWPPVKVMLSVWHPTGVMPSECSELVILLLTRRPLLPVSDTLLVCLQIIFGFMNLSSAELHGNLTQMQRLAAMEAFRKEEVNFLIATDVAARGLDIAGVQTVIDMLPPDV
jgi:hypothetical protein